MKERNDFRTCLVLGVSNRLGDRSPSDTKHPGTGGRQVACTEKFVWYLINNTMSRRNLKLNSGGSSCITWSVQDIAGEVLWLIFSLF